MLKTHKILLAGESWVSASTHYKGFDEFSSVTYHLGTGPFLAALAGTEFELHHLPAHKAQQDFPQSLSGLDAYDVVILSDIGANTLLLHPDTWIRSRPTPNRLKLLKTYVEQGGGLLMVGGYMSFQGINCCARYRGTPVAEVLPVEIHPYDDRVEVPEGFTPMVTQRGHAILSGFRGPWPQLLGFNEVIAKPDATVIATVSAEYGQKPLLVAGTFGKGRTLAWTSDIGPHWLPPEFAGWKGYARLWRQALGWLVGAR
jgi:uncharacterized membrane protein